MRDRRDRKEFLETEGEEGRERKVWEMNDSWGERERKRE